MERASFFPSPASKQRFTAAVSLIPATTALLAFLSTRWRSTIGRSPGVLAVTLSPLSVRKTVDSFAAKARLTPSSNSAVSQP